MGHPTFSAVPVAVPSLRHLKSNSKTRDTEPGDLAHSQVESYTSFLRFSLGFTMVLPINYINLPFKSESKTRAVANIYNLI